MRRREIPDIPSSTRLEAKLDRLLREGDPDLRLYVYRLIGDEAIRPPLINADPIGDLFEHLRDQFGSGRYWIIIRRGRMMELSGAISIEVPQAGRFCVV